MSDDRTEVLWDRLMDGLGLPKTIGNAIKQASDSRERWERQARSHLLEHVARVFHLLHRRQPHVEERFANSASYPVDVEYEEHVSPSMALSFRETRWFTQGRQLWYLQ